MSERAHIGDAEIEAAIRGEECLACGKYKRAGAMFCATDYFALPLAARLSLAEGAGRIDAFRSALCHLQLHGVRRRSFAEDGGWRYRTQAELEADGYELLEHTRCSVPVPNRRPYECGVRISIWRTPQGLKMAIEDATLQPHRSRCVDPEYYTRLREAKLQTSAGRRRRAR